MVKPKHKYGRYNVIGVTYDSVRVIKPKVKSTHFTTEEIRKAVRRALGNR